MNRHDPLLDHLSDDELYTLVAKIFQGSRKCCHCSGPVATGYSVCEDCLRVRQAYRNRKRAGKKFLTAAAGKR